MSGRSDHDVITTRFIKEVMRTVIVKPDGMPEMMVIVESLLFGTMLLLKQVWDINPQAAVSICEACLDQAIKRFAKENERDLH